MHLWVDPDFPIQPPDDEAASSKLLYQDDGKGVGFKGGSLHDGFDGFGGSGEHPTLLLLVLQNTAQWGDRGGFDGFGGFGGHGGFSHDGYPP